MSMIRVENLTFAYSSSYDNIFEHASLRLDTDWHTGLVGRNGLHQTQLLRQAGFVRVAPLWRAGSTVLLRAVRPGKSVDSD